MGNVPSPPSAQGQVVGSEGSAEEDGEAEDCNGEKVVVKEKERPPPAVPPADRPAGPTVAVPPAGPPADPPAAPSVGDRNLSETPRTECARTLASYATNDAKDEVTNANATNDKVAAKDGSYAARRQAEAKQRMRDKRKASAAALGRPSSILIVVVVVVVVLVSSLTFALRSEMWENRRLGRQ
jgi:cobalamin biosynthesis Mg chelatase CobN